MRTRLLRRKYQFTCYYVAAKLIAVAFRRSLRKEELYRSYFRLLTRLGFRFRDSISYRDIIYDPCSSAVGQRIYFEGNFERRELQIVGQYVKRDSVIMDIGANIGTHSVFFSQIAGNGTVFAFEPARSPYSILLKNIEGIPNIVPVNLALGDVNGQQNFYECEDDALSGLKDTKRSKVRLMSRTLVMAGDSFVEKFLIPRVDFVKIDVEGAEQRVILGLAKTLKEFHPVLFCEIYQGSNSNPDPLGTIQYLISLGYKALVLKETGLVPFPGSHDDRFYNYVFLQSEEQ